ERGQESVRARLDTFNKEKKSVISQFDAEIKRLRHMIAGESGLTPEDIDRRFQQLGVDPNTGIIPAFAALQQDKTVNDDLVLSLQQQLAERDTQIERASDEVAAL